MSKIVVTEDNTVVVTEEVNAPVEVTNTQTVVATEVVTAPVEVAKESTVALVEASVSQVEITGTEKSVVEVVAVGPQGPQGPAGDVVSIVRVAGEALGGHRVVIVDPADEKAYYADNTNAAHRYTTAGITSSAAAEGGSVPILRSGELEESSWAWTPNLPIFQATDGLMTQTPPTAGFLRVVATPASPTKIFISIHQPIQL
jgi:hypothetical protein